MSETDFDRAVRAALDDDARRAPAVEDRWPDLDRYPPPALPTRARRRWAPYVGAAVIAAAAVVALVWRAQTASEPPVPSSWQPAGTEFVLQDLGPAIRTFSISTDGLSRQLAADGQTFVVYDTIDYTFGPTAGLSHCLFQLFPDGGGAGSCMPEWDTASLDYGTTASLQNNAGPYNLWTWANVPADAAYVSYTGGDKVLWQRPVARVTMFPSVAADTVAVAYTAEGREVGRVDRATIEAATDRASRLAHPPRAEGTSEQFQELKQLTATTMSTCLTDHGATMAETTVAVFPPTVDQRAIWDTCASSTKDVVAARIAEMGLRLIDPISAQPSAPSTPGTS